MKVAPLLLAGLTCHDHDPLRARRRPAGSIWAMLIRRRSAIRRSAVRRAVPPADRGPGPRPLPAGVRRRHFRGFALARARLGRRGAGPVASARTFMPRRSTGCVSAGLVYACFCTRADIAAIADRAAWRRRLRLSRHLPRPARRSRSDARRLRTAGGWTRARALAIAGPAAAGPSRTADIRGARGATSATPSSPARMRRPPTTSPAWSTMRQRGRPGGARRRLAAIDAGAAAAAGSCSACPSRIISITRSSLHADGRRLAKRDLAPTLAAMREAGVDGPSLAAELARRQASAWFRPSPRGRAPP